MTNCFSRCRTALLLAGVLLCVSPRGPNNSRIFVARIGAARTGA
jgi:hypothetical protein